MVAILVLVVLGYGAAVLIFPDDVGVAGVDNEEVK
jgi:hypothetical protein